MLQTSLNLYLSKSSTETSNAFAIFCKVSIVGFRIPPVSSLIIEL
jgi:hypothetical protein